MLKKNRNIYSVFKVILLSHLPVFFFTDGIFADVPKPDHIVICILENHGYHQISGSPAAPYINTLISQSANLKEYYALTHPSQPNYIMLFSGDNQGVIDDNLPPGTPWSTPNLGASLISSGYSFKAFSEDLPYTGCLWGSSGDYARKHCPWTNWQGTGINQIPAFNHLSMNDFPVNFNDLPDVSFVIPNQTNDMHNGYDPSRISTADDWVRTRLKPYIDWAQMNNSLFILTFDEDDSQGVNQVLCLFNGPMVRSGNYFTIGYTHYNLLRTLEEMYHLPFAGSSASSTPIEEIWIMNPLPVNIVLNDPLAGHIYPNPLSENSVLLIQEGLNPSMEALRLRIYDAKGCLVSDKYIPHSTVRRGIPIRKEGMEAGIYIYRLETTTDEISSGKFIIE